MTNGSTTSAEGIAPSHGAGRPSTSQLVLWSAGTRPELDATTAALLDHLEQEPAGRVGEPIRVHARAPGAEHHRAALLWGGPEDAAAARKPRSERIATAAIARVDNPAGLMFPGLGDHYVNMGLDLYEAEPVFRAEVDRCAELLRPELGLDLREVLYPPSERPGVTEAKEQGAAKGPGIDLRRMLGRGADAPSAASIRLNETRLAQPALFVVEYALATSWQRRGLRVEAMIGYSLGEYVAACLAGVLSLEDSLLLVARRAQLIQGLPPGAMLAVSLPEEQVAPLVGAHLAISAINGPELCVVAGPPEEVDAFERRLVERGVTCRRVQSSHAFHSPMMAPIAEEVTRLVASLRLAAPRIPYASNVTGRLITDAEATDPRYWALHLCKPVRFADGIRTLLQRPVPVWVEGGPGQTLSSLALYHAKADGAEERLFVPSMRHAYDTQPDMTILLRAVSRLWLAGASLGWEGFPRITLQGAAVAGTGSSDSPVAHTPDDGAPRTELERSLAAIWQTLLPSAKFGRHDSFFDLGGNSMVATRLTFRLFKSFRVNVPLRRIYEAPTLAGVAATIEALMSERGGDAPVAARAGEAAAPSGDVALRRFRLPNGMDVHHQNEAETLHFYKDIFEHRSYVKHGIRLPRGAVVLDVGANIGLFTLFVHTEVGDARIYAFEPAPAMFELLRRNVAAHGVSARLFDMGISNRECTAPLTFYPNSTGMSSFRADLAEEKHVLRTILERQRAQGMDGMDAIMGQLDELLDVRFQSRTVEARLRRLSDVLRENDISRVDLLKVDVQKCELEVLEGIDAPDWARIEQVVLEVHDIEGRLGVVTGLLERHGFRVTAEQDELYVGTNIHNVYASRRA
ncbi:FkbM family methyltransferase [Polyangium aurulentum]|uniref:FkbM family methyltransferase n=1 Tax=Polyangium aurulentum TaxID=2567896 RepID=UPI0010AE104D|nr:FkbM family methyltransferase [Polyangium aurulentum]UQA57014.1 FkbM family methyltransferase [Polyangium aurulentum]